MAAAGSRTVGGASPVAGVTRASSVPSDRRAVFPGRGGGLPRGGAAPGQIVPGKNGGPPGGGGGPARAGRGRGRGDCRGGGRPGHNCSGETWEILRGRGAARPGAQGGLDGRPGRANVIPSGEWGRGAGPERTGVGRPARRGRHSPAGG